MIINDQTSLFIDESDRSISTHQPVSEPIYTEVLKRSSQNPEYGLPPTGKRTTTRIRMRSRPTRTYQLQQPTQFPPLRPASLHSSDFLEEISRQRARSRLNTFEQKKTDYNPHTDYATDLFRPTRSRSCLKTQHSRLKKSVHFDSHPPTEIRPSLAEEEDRKNELEPARRTHLVHRSFSLSPSPSPHRSEQPSASHGSRTQSTKGAEIDDISKATINHPNDEDMPSRRKSINGKDTLNPQRTSVMIKAEQANSFLLQPIANHHRTTMQTSTLIISTPPQCHYYLYPTSKKKHVRMNSASTSSSSSSCELEEETTGKPPIVLSDSVQNFWPPPPSPTDLEQNNHSQFPREQNRSLRNDESFSMSNTLPPADDDEELRSYSEQSSLSTACLRIASNSSIEDTQESYSERLRQTSRTIQRPVMMNGSKYTLARTKSKENLTGYLRPKSAGQIRQEIADDFQSKRQFFENRTYAEDAKQPPLPPPDSTIRTTKYFDGLANQTVYRKPVRVVKAMQRAAPSPSSKPSLPSTSVHFSSEYIKHLFPTSDRFKPTNNSSSNLKQRVEIWENHQRTIRQEMESNELLGKKLLQLIESQAEFNEIEKFKLHVRDIETITSVFLKLSGRLAKVENDLSTRTTDDKSNLLAQREKIQQKHEEAKTLKEGIDRRSRLVRAIGEKYLLREQLEEYEQFIRMKSTLLIEQQDCEENILFLRRQIQDPFNTSSSSSSPQTYFIQTNDCKAISTTA